MAEAINMHKRIAMGGEGEANHLKKGGKVQKYAAGGKVMSEKGVANLPPRGDKKNGGVDFNAGKAKIATMKRGGTTNSVKRASGRGR